jgi:hypothetical protein
MISLAAREQIKLVVQVDDLVVVGVLDPTKVSTVRLSCRRLCICGASRWPSMTMHSLTESERMSITGIMYVVSTRIVRCLRHKDVVLPQATGLQYARVPRIAGGRLWVGPCRRLLQAGHVVESLASPLYQHGTCSLRRIPAFWLFCQ